MSDDGSEERRMYLDAIPGYVVMEIDDAVLAIPIAEAERLVAHLPEFITKARVAEKAGTGLLS